MMPDAEASDGLRITTAGATVIIFPLGRRIGKARHMALLYSRKSEKEAASYWRVQCNTMFRQLLDLGCSPDDADAQLLDLRDAVRAELVRRGHLTYTQASPDGAA